MAGLKVVAVKVHPDGNLDLVDLKAKAEKHKDNLAAFMVGISCFYYIHANLPTRSPIPRLSECLSLVSRTLAISSTTTAVKFTSTVPTSTHRLV